MILRSKGNPKKIKTLKFDKEYKKLDNASFTTIREVDKEYSPGEIVYMITPTRKLRCEHIQSITLPFKSIHEDFLCEDCEVKTPFEARDLLKTCFPDLTFDTPMKIISFLRRDIWTGDQMARDMVVDDTMLCKRCLCPTVMLQKRKDDLWRCVNSLCEKSKEGGGYMLGEDRIPIEKVSFLVDLIEVDIKRKGETEFKKEPKRYLN